MRKIKYGLIIGACIVAFSISIYIKNSNIYQIPQNNLEKETTTSKNKVELLDEVEKEHGYKLYRPEQTVKVEGAKDDLTINESSDEAAVIENMHEMTHQKVQAENKKGAIEMTQAHINSVYNIVERSNFEHKDKLLEILIRWKNNDSNKIVDDHNDLWTIQGGKTGSATGRLTTQEEKEFISNNFKR